MSAHWRCQSYWFEQAIDIKDFCSQLILDMDFLNLQFDKFPDSELDPLLVTLSKIFRVKCNEVIGAVHRSVIAIGSLGADYQFSNGISLFFPWTIRAFRLMQQPYLNLMFTVEKGEFWLKFLEDYLQTTRRLKRDSQLPTASVKPNQTQI